MEYQLTPTLNHPAYQARVKLRGYTSQVSVIGAHSNADGAKVLCRLNPEWSKDDHKRLAYQHALEAERLKARYSDLLEQAAQETFGRSWQVSDYRVSAIGRDEFSPAIKDALRFAAHAQANHQAIARAHQVAAQRLN